ncbi:phycobilisome rod-core linker polypeptide [Gloeocapsa sp. PCC 73106]|uniref:phycobilisome rod-core linker polypeptide n=1 Tax=Gloeocapsa sp. PCC 73106 TaxID=102232 RepID=UPI0002ABB8C7|nr:phycobilisome rod-core linker polypeptide [Gloeocapsa sp. PCC 73106]ELR99587.1 Phycobilisome Linker polypeptide [Gloeocapsa sp. PCC 73106]
MSIPLLNYSPSSQNQRVNGFEIPGDEYPRIYSLDNLPQGKEMDEVIWACYRQIFNEQQILDFNRQLVLESQLKNGQLTIRDFIKGLLLSDVFRRSIYETNSNYRFVEICFQRVLGRPVYNKQEKLSWSIILATEGLTGFVDKLLYSDEYTSSFGDQIVPYQRRRILPQRSVGDLPNARTPRYDAHHLAKLKKTGLLLYTGQTVKDNSASVYRKVILLVPVASVALLIAVLISVANPLN